MQVSAFLFPKIFLSGLTYRRAVFFTQEGTFQTEFMAL